MSQDDVFPASFAAAAATNAGSNPSNPAERNLDRTALRIPGYRVVRRLAQGGMGVVYEAEQLNPSRRVAIKVLRSIDIGDERKLQLFSREIRALARLRHPGIASIYESGVAEDGSPFFSMELVQGFSLTDHRSHIMRSDMSLEARRTYFLTLFLEICSAVIYAHQRGIIHRDLKPNNILVQAEALSSGSSGGPVSRVKILDFGLARIADDESDSGVTQTGIVQGTLAYMSPEQVTGRVNDLDVRSDVYSLGLLLHQLLTGRLPYDFESFNEAMAAVVICQSGVRSLSDSADDERPFDADLECIVAKALEKERSRRYQQVSEFVDDLVRFRNREPIRARPPSKLYQLRKLYDRYRVAFVASAAFLLLLITTIISLSIMNTRLTRETERANREARTAREVAAFMVKLFDDADPMKSRGPRLTAREVLDEGVNNIERDLADQPEVQAQLMRSMGNAYRSLSDWDRSKALLEKALKLTTRTYGNDSLEHAKALTDLGDFYRDKRDHRQAEPLLRRAKDILEKRGQAQTNRMAEVLNDLGLVMDDRGRGPEAERLFKQALSIREALLPPDHASTLVLKSNLASVLAKNGDPIGGIGLFEQVIAARRRTLGPNHPRTALAMARLSNIHHETGDLDTAEALQRAALDIQRKALGERHHLTTQLVNDLASTLQDQGKFAESEQMYRHALAMDMDVNGPESIEVATVMNNLASLLEWEGKYKEALP
ncbi:MAG TPA: serine/threonine-protein kinase, partial [Bryobacteraceae bacterium]|nr:serine/threonine-protein kinase [Bryobacteraceae bacterium]